MTHDATNEGKAMTNKDERTEPRTTEEHSPGKGCQCGAYGKYECGCDGIDWRSRREVELERMVKDKDAEIVALKAEIVSLNAVNKIHLDTQHETGRMLLNCQAERDALKAERDAFQTQAGARKKECFELHLALDGARKVMKKIKTDHVVGHEGTAHYCGYRARFEAHIQQAEKALTALDALGEK